MNTAETAAPRISVLGTHSAERALRNVDWVAQFLGVSKSWVYQASASGVLPSIRLGGALRFSRESLEEWLRGDGGKSVRLPGCR